VVKQKYQNNLFSNHFLEERIQELDEWHDIDFETKYREVKNIYDSKEDFLASGINEDQTQQKFIDPVLNALGHDWAPEAQRKVGSATEGKTLRPDYAFLSFEKELEVSEDDHKDYFDESYAVGDAKAWNRTLDRSSQDHSNPAFQIYNYVDRLRADWGILTNGKKWRLYCYEDCAADIYFEINLETILSGEKTEQKLEAFKYFYLFFRAEGFREGFLQNVYRRSVEYNQGLEDSLENKVYSALEVAVKGFFETNELEKTSENIDLVHSSSLIFLYRTLFILNAESRDLLPTDDEAYRQAFGLTELKRIIVDEDGEDALFQETTVAWDNRLSRLFEGIDDGYDLHETEIPAYNGGLFDEESSEENRFLAENKLYGSYIKQILELLATRYDEQKERRVIVDYKDLNIRHLGSIYEGLLEHQFKAAGQRKILENGEWTEFSETNKEWEEVQEEKRVEKGGLYLTNESGERKSTGSYYTPEYIVEYIVENTVGPKIEEKIEQAKQSDQNVLPRILELNICDPAMGSGHFLTEATEYIAEHVVEHADLEQQNIDENEDELNWAKRQVVQNCIYGVDVNKLAVELGKLSLWIETAAKGKPLNFLDHHLKHGNSLIGSDFNEIFSHPTENQTQLDSERYKFGDPQDIKEGFQKQYLEIEQMPENTVEQIHEKEQAYKQFIQENVLYQQFQQLANIHTRQYFEKEANSSDYEGFLINIGNPGNPFENTEWYKNAQQDAENRNYFHWQLEFPKVFFGQQEGFDAVVGNPPYVRQEVITELKDYLEVNYDVYTGRGDLYSYFIERANHIASDKLGYIVSHKFTKVDSGEPLRKYLMEETTIEEFIDFQDLPVFGDDVSAYPAIVISSKDLELDKFKYAQFNSLGFDNLPEKVSELAKEVPISALGTGEWKFISETEKEVRNKVQSKGESLSEEVREPLVGVKTGLNEILIIDEDKKEEISENKFDEKFIRPITFGKEVKRYNSPDGDQFVIFPYERGEDSLEVLDLDKAQGVKNYLEEHESDLKDRAIIKDKYPKGEMEWYELQQINENVDPDSEKIIYPDISAQANYTIESGSVIDMTAFIVQSDSRVYLSELNSSLLEWYLSVECAKARGGYLRFKTQYVGNLPLINEDDIDEQTRETLEERVQEIMERKAQRGSINLNIQDYLGNYSDGKTLGDLYSPAEGLSEKVVSDTSADRDSLRIGGVEFEERNCELILKVSARYKPDDSENIDEDELDRWGYFETEKVPAMKFNVEDKMRPLIEEFVSLAVDQAGGFADFRESATKTNSIIDRLEKLTLPKLEDVEQGLEKFIDNREEAEKLEEEIQETDELIDAIVFELYDLTEEEVETVLDSLDASEGEKTSVLENFGSLN
jgi:type I restriction-modification system DNA methylase subunit